MHAVIGPGDRAGVKVAKSREDESVEPDAAQRRSARTSDPADPRVTVRAYRSPEMAQGQCRCALHHRGVGGGGGRQR